MKKLFTLALFIVSCANLRATQTAIYSIGPAGIYITDDNDPILYPAEIINYPRLLIFNLDSFPPSHNRMSFTCSWGDENQPWGAFGFSVSDLFMQDDIERAIQSLNRAIAENPLMSPNNKLPLPESKYHVYYARELGRIMAGLHLSTAYGENVYSYSDDISQDAFKRNATAGISGIEGGISAVIRDNLYLQTGLGYEKINFNSRFELSGADPIYWEEIKDKAGNVKRFNARLFYGLNDQIKVVPVLSYKSIYLAYRANYSDMGHMPGLRYGGTESGFSQVDINAAVGIEFKPVNSIKILGGISSGINSTEITDSNNIWLVSAGPTVQYKNQKDDNIILPGIQGGIEANPNNWLNMRLGVCHNSTLVYSKIEHLTGRQTAESSYTKSDFNYYCGIGFKFGRLQIDAQLNQYQLYNLGYMLGGTNGPAFTRLSVKYAN